ncbi:ParB/RepB/Spo0J family partition protein [Nonomuraea sp. NPDC050790]|uniref:ParB/RepB/Spo0J family partition protein n=1 Tax=Nonomuraea sp. NPDC050790 TaxID=3364371 RepID=UPI00379C30ED
MAVTSKSGTTAAAEPHHAPDAPGAGRTAASGTSGTKPRGRASGKATTPARPRAAKPAAAPTAKITSKKIPVALIDRDPGQPRKHFDQAKLDELAESMRKLGQLQPVTVRPSADGRYMLIMGERRWRAAQIAGLTEMHTLVHHGIADGDRETLAKAVAENVGRVDMTPLEEADGFQRLIETGYELDEVASMCGKSPAYVKWRIDLLKLSLPVQEALSKGHLPVGLAWYVANLAPDNQQRFLTRWVRGDFASAREAEAFAQACRDEETRQASQGSMFVLADTTDSKVAAAEQANLFGEADVPAEERERIAHERKLIVTKIDKLAGATAILAELATADAAELALLLSGVPGGVNGQKLRIDHLKDVAGKAAANLRQAQAAASVRASALQVSPDVVASPAA